jgi:hypothetical protein
MAIKATFSAGGRLLSEFGDDAGNVIVTSRDAAGQLFVNGGTVPVEGNRHRQLGGSGEMVGE